MRSIRYSSHLIQSSLKIMTAPSTHTHAHIIFKLERCVCYRSYSLAAPYIQLDEYFQSCMGRRQYTKVKSRKKNIDIEHHHHHNFMITLQVYLRERRRQTATELHIVLARTAHGSYHNLYNNLAMCAFVPPPPIYMYMIYLYNALHFICTYASIRWCAHI